MKNNTSKKGYKFGPTTGSIATACALASLKKLLNNEEIAIVQIKTPQEKLDIFLDSCKKITTNKAKASAHKYPYDDPDVTVNIEIITEVELVDKNSINIDYNNPLISKEDNVIIKAGCGIGKVTKKGLQIPIGEYAINPVPRKMIKENLKNIVPNNKIAIVTIYIPKGEKLAKRTMNPRIGIIGGISVLGTTGIARSMSTKAYKDSLLIPLNIAIEEGYKDLIFVPGNIGEKIANKILDINPDQVIQMTNFVGFIFEEAEKRGIKKAELVGHIGKLVKLAGGIFNTKHSIADGRREIFAAHTGICGADTETIKDVYKCKTTEEIIEILKKKDLDIIVLNSIADAIRERVKDRFDIELNVIIVDMEGNILNSNYNKRLLK
ncbi:cobalamin biosynthesis protein CbiD [Methanobrevibacter sp. 87.7]|uniref:cobalt-precorrin-5B (C(1))-methyltransferase CbiD n=1 Tax=Methanobrevibacter sp. 87.7 TaxID=387957 RepID=UPI000B50AC3A|nr:cobalt-precorrin-5B (C(1))-methyltransferase CbiD [Methanobrevibacter sp. 87.7]OWT33253.1 cobalamin biosynthesis protein CbiD [Methanobrevibacter sp. 87.7]